MEWYTFIENDYSPTFPKDINEEDAIKCFEYNMWISKDGTNVNITADMTTEHIRNAMKKLIKFCNAYKVDPTRYKVFNNLCLEYARRNGL